MNRNLYGTEPNCGIKIHCCEDEVNLTDLIFHSTLGCLSKSFTVHNVCEKNM